jgi:hypothetical protein
LQDLNPELYQELSKQKPIRMLIQGGRNIGMFNKKGEDKD